MILKTYNQTNANRLIRLSFPEISEPFPYRVLWLRCISILNSRKGITRNRHRHSFFEVHYILEGKTQYKDTDGTLHTVEAGEGILFSPGVSHTLIFNSDNLIKICLAFSCNTNNPPFDALCKNDTFLFSIDEKIEGLFETILEEVESRSLFSFTLIQNCVFELICRLLRCTSSFEHNTIVNLPEDDTRILAVKQYIRDNPDRFLTCSEVAQYCHFNVKYLNRIFKNVTGITLLSYIHQQKSLQIQELLEHSDLSLSEISRRLGFRNEYYLNSFFKRLHGMPPNVYRKFIQKQNL